MAVVCFERINSDSRARSIDCPEVGGDGQFRLTNLVFEALRIHRVPLKVAARDLGYDESYFSRIKSGEKGLHLDRVWLLPEPVRRTFFELGAEQNGQRVVAPDRRQQAFGRLLRAMGEAMEELDDERGQLALPLRAGRPLKAGLE